MKDIKKIARDIKEEARDYPADVRYEVLEELAAIAVREEELTAAEISQLYILLG
jgi:hypothetical protein